MKKLNNQAKISLLTISALCLLWLLPKNYELVLNHSQSLPIKAVVIRKGEVPSKNGQIFVFRVRNNPHFKMPEVNFIKLVGGLAGEEITTNDREVYVEERLIGTAKMHSLKGAPLTIINQGLIPEHKFFAYTPHKDSFDSRYQDLGLIDEKDIIGTAVFAF